MEDKNFNILRKIEENERWLAGFDTPVVSAEKLSGVKNAVRDELARNQAQTFAMRWKPWHGAFVAAAMVMLSVGVVRFAGLQTSPAVRFTDSGAAGLLAMVEFDVPDVEPSIVDAELDELEAWQIGDSWALSGASMFQTFEDALSEDGVDDTDEVGATGPQSGVSGAIG